MDNAPRLAGVMELVDVPDSKSGAARRGGSSPPPGTTKAVNGVNRMQLQCVKATDTSSSVINVY